MEIVYKAKDGKEFSDKDECLLHETHLSIPELGKAYSRGELIKFFEYAFPEDTNFVFSGFNTTNRAALGLCVDTLTLERLYSPNGL